MDNSAEPDATAALEESDSLPLVYKTEKVRD